MNISEHLEAENNVTQFLADLTDVEKKTGKPTFCPAAANIGDLPPLPSRSTRRIAKRSKSSSRGGIIVQLPSWQRPRIVYFESRLELRVLYILLARGDVIDLWEQPPSITYRDDDGQRSAHYFDFLIELASGRRIAIAVKPAKFAKGSDFVSTLRCIRQAMRKSYADDLILITEQDFSKAEATNAERYFDFSRHRDLDLDCRLRALLEKTSFPTTIGKLGHALDAGGAGYRAVFLAIYGGILTADKTNILDLQTEVSSGVVK